MARCSLPARVASGCAAKASKSPRSKSTLRVGQLGSPVVMALPGEVGLDDFGSTRVVPSALRRRPGLGPGPGRRDQRERAGMPRSPARPGSRTEPQRVHCVTSALPRSRPSREAVRRYPDRKAGVVVGGFGPVVDMALRLRGRQRQGAVEGADVVRQLVEVAVQEELQLHHDRRASAPAMRLIAVVQFSVSALYHSGRSRKRLTSARYRSRNRRASAGGASSR